MFRVYTLLVCDAGAQLHTKSVHVYVHTPPGSHVILYFSFAVCVHVCMCACVHWCIYVSVRVCMGIACVQMRGVRMHHMACMHVLAFVCVYMHVLHVLIVVLFGFHLICPSPDFPVPIPMCQMR